MTLLNFIQIGCVLVFITYVVSVNLFKGANKVTGGRPEPGLFTFFPKKKRGLTKEEIEHVLDPEGRNKPAPKP